MVEAIRMANSLIARIPFRKPALKLSPRLSKYMLPRIASSQEVQLLLKHQWRALRGSGAAAITFKDVGFSNYSEFEEDGILLFIFALIGEESRRVVEICAGNGMECMAANQIINHGWEGFLFDGDPRNAEVGRAFFANTKGAKLMDPRFTSAWITAENVDDLLTEAGVVGEVDLFSLDIDGNDYWVWRAIEAIRPRVCVFETSDCIPTAEALTVPYDPDFNARDKPFPQTAFRGASLAAMTKLSRERGYRLIGAHRHGFNVFFMRDDVGRDYFPEVDPVAIHDNPWTRRKQQEWWPQLAGFPWERV